MSGIAALVVLPCALLSADALSYPVAARDAQTKQQPLLVLVGADWCPGCQTMKHSVLPALARAGALRKVSYATIDTDREPELAGQIMRGGAIPQLIVFSRQPDGKWHREQLIGTSSQQEVQSLIVRALDAQKHAALAATSSFNP
jgi:thioredoxin-like negative regulator of GroEL